MHRRADPGGVPCDIHRRVRSVTAEIGILGEPPAGLQGDIHAARLHGLQPHIEGAHLDRVPVRCVGQALAAGPVGPVPGTGDVQAATPDAIQLAGPVVLIHASGQLLGHPGEAVVSAVDAPEVVLDDPGQVHVEASLGAVLGDGRTDTGGRSHQQQSQDEGPDHTRCRVLPGARGR